MNKALLIFQIFRLENGINIIGKLLHARLHPAALTNTFQPCMNKLKISIKGCFPVIILFIISVASYYETYYDKAGRVSSLAFSIMKRCS